MLSITKKQFNNDKKVRISLVYAKEIMSILDTYEKAEECGKSFFLIDRLKFRVIIWEAYKTKLNSVSYILRFTVKYLVKPIVSLNLSNKMIT